MTEDKLAGSNQLSKQEAIEKIEQMIARNERVENRTQETEDELNTYKDILHIFKVLEEPRLTRY